MLTPNDFAPKGKAPSIWSVDSGYGSNTLEDDEPLQRSERYPAEHTNTRYTPAIGLGISGFWNVHVKDQLRLSKSEIPVTPVTTKLNVFTTIASTQDNAQHPLPQYGSGSACVTCQLWDITNPGQGLKCDNCRNKTCIKPSVLQRLDTKLHGKLAVPRLVIPHDPQPRSFPSQRPTTRCSACDLAAAINPGASSSCTSCTPDPDFLTPISPVQPSTVKRSCARRPGKLPAHALFRLRAWLKENRENPYPTQETKQALASECQITEKQVTTWFTNTRARKLALPNDRSYPSSEDDNIYESDFSSVTNTPVVRTSEYSGHGTPLAYQHNSPFAGPSTMDNGLPQVQTSRRGKKKDYRRMNTLSPIDHSPVPRTPVTRSPSRDGADQELWPCTYCPQQLAPKSWRRHEETQHRPKHQWICLATSPRLTIPSQTGSYSICAFCHLKNPSDEHFMHSHRIAECKRKPESERTFGRPDHLRQHVKNFHKTSLLDFVRAAWKRDGPGKNVNESWTCGFCAAELKTWDVRETHIANHFKVDRCTMASWKEYSPSHPASARASSVVEGQMFPDAQHPLFTKMQRTLSGLSNGHNQTRHSTPLHSGFSNTFAALPVSTGCSNSNIASASMQAGLSHTYPATSHPESFANLPLDININLPMNPFDSTYPNQSPNPNHQPSTPFNPHQNQHPNQPYTNAYSSPFPNNNGNGNNIPNIDNTNTNTMPGDFDLDLALDEAYNAELFGNFLDYQGVWEGELGNGE